MDAREIWKNNNENNVLVWHNLEINHNFKDSKMFVITQNKKHGKIVESNIIFYYNSIKQTPGFFQLISLSS